MNTTFFAFSAGKTSDTFEAKRYIGVAPVSILAVNPNKETLESIFNTTIETEPTYVGEVEVGEEKIKTPNVRLDFIVKTDEAKCGADLTTRVTFFLRKDVRSNRDHSKIQVIDKYGRTCWVTNEQAQNHEIPMYANGPANIDKDYRPCFTGEEDLTNFIKNYLNIPNVMKYVNGSWMMSNTPSECEARLEHIEDYFKGDFSELEDVISAQPKNKVKVMFGVRTADDNRLFQAAYIQMTLKNTITDYSRLANDLQSRKASGAYPNVEFKAVPIEEYVVGATDFSKEEAIDDLPFGDSPWS